MEWTFPATAALRADLELQSGAIVVSLEPTDEVKVSLEPAGAWSDKAREQIEGAIVTCDGHLLTVQVPKRKLRDVPLLLTVMVPPQSTLTATTASADVRIAGACGPLGVRTASGDVDFSGTCDLADVSTASGDVKMGSVLGEGRVKTASGDVLIDGVGGRATLDTASGDVILGSAGSDVRMRTASGDISVSSVSQGAVEAHTASGDVRIGVPPGVGTWLDIVTVSGSTKCTLPAEGSAEAEATLRITARTVSGDVVVESASSSIRGFFA